MSRINHNNESTAVGNLTEIIALEYGASARKAKQINTAAALHDIGKLKIPPAILNKPGKLTPREYDIIKTHTLLGAEMLKSAKGELGVMARACCLFHHEWYDGGGYWGIRMDALPFYIPYLAIADVFTALVSQRVYKDAWPPAKAVRYIQKKSGTQFDPELVKDFISLVSNDDRVPVILTEVMK